MEDNFSVDIVPEVDELEFNIQKQIYYIFLQKNKKIYYEKMPIKII